jgi:signal transduction histidine kinase
LSEVGEVLAAGGHPRDLVSKVAERCVPSLGRFCAVGWEEPSPGDLVVVSAEVAAPALSRERLWEVAQAIEQSGGVLVRASGGDQPASDLPAGTWVCAPLQAATRRLGWLVLMREPAQTGGTPAELLSLVREIAQRLATALESSVLMEEAATAEALRAVDQAKALFIATAAHELRTPLQSVMGFAELLRSPDVAPELRDRWLGIMHKESVHLSQLLDQLMETARVDGGELRRERVSFDIRDTIEDVLATFDPAAAISGHTLERVLPADLPRAFADPTHVGRVVRNIVSNAVKYSPAGGRVRVGVRVSGDREIEVTVQDHGLGIPAEWLPRLFARFLRVDTPDRATIRGTGLGLYIARKLVELQEGRIWAASAGPGQGTTVGFTVPIAPPEEWPRRTGDLIESQAE